MLVVKCEKVRHFSYRVPRPADLWTAIFNEDDTETTKMLEEAGLNVMTSTKFYHGPYNFFRFRAYDEMKPIGEIYVHDELIDSCSKEGNIRDFLNEHYKDLIFDQHADIELHLDIDKPFCHSDPYNHAILRKIVVNVKGVAFS